MLAACGHFQFHIRRERTTQTMIFSATYCLELHVPIYVIYYQSTFLPSKDVNVLYVQTTNSTMVGKNRDAR